MQDRCEIRIEDYRDVSGTYDRLRASVCSSTSAEKLRMYFSRIRSLLSDDGAALNHRHHLTDAGDGQAYAAGGDFIDRYVFPDGELAHIGVVLKEICAAGLGPVDVENLRRHYAITLRHWADRFEKAGERLHDIAGKALPHLARVPRRLRLWLRPQLGCFASDIRSRRIRGTPSDAQLHVPLSTRPSRTPCKCAKRLSDLYRQTEL